MRSSEWARRSASSFAADRALQALHGYASTTNPPLADALAAVGHPTLIVVWETDPVHLVTTARYLRSTMPDATLRVSGTVDDVRTWTNRIDGFLW